MTPFLLPGAVIAEDNSEHGTLEISLQSHWPAHFGSGIRREFLAIPGRILLGDLGPESLQACRHSHPLPVPWGRSTRKHLRAMLTKGGAKTRGLVWQVSYQGSIAGAPLATQ